MSAYLDGELTPDDQAEVEAFIEKDADARRLLAELRATIEAVRALPRARASDDLMDGLRGRMERQALLGEEPAGGTSPPSATPFQGRWLAAAAVVALACTAGYLMWALSDEEPTGAPARQQYALTEPRRPAEGPASTRENEGDVAGAKGLAMAGADGRDSNGDGVGDLITAAPAPAAPKDGFALGEKLRRRGAETVATDLPSKGNGDVLAKAKVLDVADKEYSGDSSDATWNAKTPTELDGDDFVGGVAASAKPATERYAGTAVAALTADPSPFALPYAERLADYFMTMKESPDVTVRTELVALNENVQMVELEFVDEARRQEAVAVLCNRFAFKPDSTPALDYDVLDAPRRGYGVFEGHGTTQPALSSAEPAHLERRKEEGKAGASASPGAAEEGEMSKDFNGLAPMGRLQKQDHYAYADSMSYGYSISAASRGEIAETDKLVFHGGFRGYPTVATALTLDVPDRQTLTTIVAKLEAETGGEAAEQALLNGGGGGTAGTRSLRQEQAGAAQVEKGTQLSEASRRGGKLWTDSTEAVADSLGERMDAPSDDAYMLGSRPAGEPMGRAPSSAAPPASQPAVRTVGGDSEWGERLMAFAPRTTRPAETRPASVTTTNGVSPVTASNVVRIYLRLAPETQPPADHPPTINMSIKAPEPPQQPE